MPATGTCRQTALLIKLKPPLLHKKKKKQNTIKMSKRPFKWEICIENIRLGLLKRYLIENVMRVYL